jgi:hypothetical protein
MSSRLRTTSATAASKCPCSEVRSGGNNGRRLGATRRAPCRSAPRVAAAGPPPRRSCF